MIKRVVILTIIAAAFLRAVSADVADGVVPDAPLAVVEKLSAETDTSVTAPTPDTAAKDASSMSDAPVTPSKSDTAAPHDKTFALVLSGGGSRGLAQIGVLRALDEAGLRPDLIVATSMGAIVGGLYACGYSPDDILKFMTDMDWGRAAANAGAADMQFVSQKSNPREHLFDLRLANNFQPIWPNSISNGQVFYEALSGKVASALYHADLDFDRLPVRLRVVATDVLTGARRVFSHGSLSTAIRASCAVPLAFSPVELDGMYLMDGGLTSNIPVQTALDEGAAFVVASDVTSPLWKQEDMAENPVRFMEQLVAIGVEQNKRRDLANADIIIRPALDGVANTDFSRVEELAERGYRAALAVIPAIKAALAQTDPAAKTPPRREWMPVIMRGRDGNLLLSADSIMIDMDKLASVEDARTADINRIAVISPHLLSLIRARGLEFSTVDSIMMRDGILRVYADVPVIREVRVFGNDKTAERLALVAGGLRSGGGLSGTAIDRAVLSLYSTELFENVKIEVEPDMRVSIHLKEKRYWRVRGGLRYDEFHLGEGFVEPAYENLFGHGISAAMRLQYGMQREKYSLVLKTNQLFTSNWASNYRLQIFTMREKIYSREIILNEEESRPNTIEITDDVLGKSGVSMLVGWQIGRSVAVEFGSKMELFEHIETNRTIFEDVPGFGFRHTLPYFTARLNIDTRDAATFTNNGHRHVITAGMAGEIINLGGTEEFWKLDGNFNRHYTLRDRHTFHGQIIAGWTSASLPEVEKFYLGGAISEPNYRDADIYNIVPFMGLAARSISADIFALGHFEYRVRLRRNLFISGIVDWARLWAFEEFNTTDPESDADTKNPLGMGLCLSYRTPLGPIRLTYGQLIRHKYTPVNEHKPVFYFSAGYDF